MRTETSWGRYDKIRRDALWREADQVLISRAMGRLGLVSVWIALAVLAAPGHAWLGALPALVFTAVSLLHAAQTMVLRLERRLPWRASQLMKRIFVYPDRPHISWPGIGETAGSLSLAMATGWPGRLLIADPAAAAVGSAITIAYVSSFFASVTGHPVWEIDRGPNWMHRSRRLLAPLGALAAASILWSASPETAPRVVAVAGPLLLIGFCWRGADQVGQRVRDFAAAMDQTREKTHEFDSLMVHSELKNGARAVLEDLQRISDPVFREQVQRLCYNIGSFTHVVRRGGDVRIGSAAEAVSSVLAFNEEWSRRYQYSVLEDLDLGELTRRDAAIIFVAVTDLVTNAARHRAETLEVRLVATLAEHGCTLRLGVFCRCGVTLNCIDPRSSLMALARLVHGENGSMMLTDAGDGSHRFELTWPSPAQPQVRVPRAESAHAS